MFSSYQSNIQAMRPSNITRAQQPLTLQALQTIVPSAFATQPHESRSNRYAYIPTSEIISGLMREGFQPFSAVQSRTRIPGKAEFTKHLIRFRHQSTDIARQVGDVVPEVAVMNSHDGSSSYWIMEALYRLACLNGMFRAVEGGQTHKVQHTGNVLDQVIQSSYQVIEDSTKALAVASTWATLQLSDGEQHAMAEAAHHIRFSDAEGNVSTPITAEQLLAPRRAEDARNRQFNPYSRNNRVGSDLWTTFNVVQENVIKGGLHGVQRATDERGRATRRNVTTREVKGIDQDVKLNRALWMLAERMASLKGVAAAS
jgi:hypothetical protein